MTAIIQRLSPHSRGSLFYGLYWGMIGFYSPFLFVYFSQLGFSGTQVGLLSSILSLCSLVVAPLVSRLADHTNRRRDVLALCLTGSGVMLAVFPVGRTFWIAALLYSLLNIFHAPASSIADGLVVRMANTHALNYGGMRMWGSLVFALVSALLGLVWERAGFQMMFWVSGGLVLLIAWVPHLLEEPRTYAAEETSAVQHAPISAVTLIRQDRRLMLLLAALGLIGASMAMVFTFESIYVTFLGGTRVVIGVMSGLSALSELPPMLFNQRILHRLGDLNTLLLSFALFGLAFFGYGLAGSIWVIYMLNILKGLAFGLFFIAAVVIIDRRAPARLAATYQGVMAAVVWGLAPMIASPLGGWLYEQFQPRTLFLAAGLIVAIAGLVLVPAFGKDNRSG